MEKVGKDGVITVEESKGLEFETEYTEGMQIDRGYLSPYFVTNPERMEAELDDPFILITDKKISAIADILPVLEKVAAARRAAGDHRRGRRRGGPGDPGRQQAARHPQRPGGQSPGLRRPPQGDAARHRGADRRPGHLRGDRPHARQRRPSQDLGRARRVVSTKDDTTFIEGAGDPDAIKGRIEQIRAQIETTTSDFDREKLQERLAKLAGGVAVIKVGAATETELKEKKHRVEDALSATRAAVEEGIVPGGGVALINAISALDGVQAEGDVQTGVNILRRALEEPLRGIVSNAGMDGGGRDRDGPPRPEGAEEPQRRLRRDWPSTTSTCCRPGIIDPAKVTRSAVENAASIAGMILTTEALITDKPEKSGSGRQRHGWRHGRHGRRDGLLGQAPPANRAVRLKGARSIGRPSAGCKASGPRFARVRSRHASSQAHHAATRD